MNKYTDPFTFGTIRDTPRRHYPGAKAVVAVGAAESIRQLRRRCFAERRAVGMANLARQRATWHLSNRNLLTVIRSLFVGSWVPAESIVIVEGVLSKPWNYRIEFVVARCREVDGTEDV